MSKNAEAGNVVVFALDELLWVSLADGSEVRRVTVPLPSGWDQIRIKDAVWAGGFLYIAADVEKVDAFGSTIASGIMLAKFAEDGMAITAHIIHGSSGFQRAIAITANGAGLAYLGHTDVSVDVAPGIPVTGYFACAVDAELAPSWATDGLPGGADIAIATTGEVAVVGAFSGTYSPFWGDPDWRASESTGAFIIALSHAGAYQWHRIHDGAGVDIFQSVSYDNREGLMVSGTFSGTMNVAPRGNLTATGSNDAFFGIFGADDGDRFVSEARHLSTSRSAAVSHAAVDAFGNLVLIGRFHRDITLPSGTLYTTATVADSDVFLVRVADIP